MKEKKNKHGLKSRWEPSYTAYAYAYADDADEFLGYAGELDVWVDRTSEEVVTLAVVGPESRKIKEESPHNFDTFRVEGGNLISRGVGIDLHIDVHDMCLIYAVCVEEGIFDRENPNA